jgi:4-amino-4-deoxy-L-arabinose transferase-like glycosyltransferase
MNDVRWFSSPGTNSATITSCADRGAWPWAVLVALIIGMTGLFLAYSEKPVPPWDPSSMVLLTKALTESRGIQYVDANNAQIGPYFNPHGFDIRAPGDPQPYSTFPPGFSLMLAAAYGLGGLRWLYLVPPLMNAVGMTAAAYLGYRIAGPLAGILAALLLGSSRVVATFATSLWSDGPSLDLLLLGLALYVAAIRSKRPGWFLLSGFCLGLLILTKFVNLAFVSLIVGYHLLSTRGRSRVTQLGWLALGLAPGLVALLTYQARAYGAPLASAYSPWGQALYPFALFSPKYLFVTAPPPWNDISSHAIAQGLLRDMHIWLPLAIAGLVLSRRCGLAWLLALLAIGNIAIYSMSVFTPRQFINMRYLLPALAMGYILAAVPLAWVVNRRPERAVRAVLLAIIVLLSVGGLARYTLPELVKRNRGTDDVVSLVITTSRALPAGSVVLAYSLADTFILYGNASVLNYRRVEASTRQARNQLVLEAIARLLRAGKSVYLVKDDDNLFASIFPDIQARFKLRELSMPLTTYQLLPTGNANGQPPSVEQ